MSNAAAASSLFALLLVAIFRAGCCGEPRQLDEWALTNQNDPVDIWNDPELASEDDASSAPWTLVEGDLIEWNEGDPSPDRIKRDGDAFEGSGEEDPATAEAAPPSEAPPEEPASDVAPPPPPEENPPPQEGAADAPDSEAPPPPETPSADAPPPPPPSQTSSRFAAVDSAPSEQRTPLLGVPKEGEAAKSGEEPKGRSADPEAKEGRATEATKASGGGKVTLLIVAGIIIVGAAAFTYHYCKKRVTTANQPEPVEKELMEITVAKRVDPQQEKNANADQQRPLLENNGRQNANSVEIQELKEEPEEESEEGRKNGRGQQRED